MKLRKQKQVEERNPEPVIKEPVPKPVYQHLTRAKCPRCGSLSPIADGTRSDGRIKRWKCRNPVCRKQFKSVGVLLPEKK